MRDQRELVLDPVYVGSTPRPLDITVGDADGGVVDLTAATASFTYKVNDGTSTAGTATVQAPATAGVIRVTWSAAQFTTAGMLRGTVYYTAGTVKDVAATVVVRVITPPSTIS
jgi:hypothetical protein